MPLVFIVATQLRMLARFRWQIRSGIGNRLHPGLFIDRHRDDGKRLLAVARDLVLPVDFLIDKEHLTHFLVKLRIASLHVVFYLVLLQRLVFKNTLYRSLGGTPQTGVSMRGSIVAHIFGQLAMAPDFSSIPVVLRLCAGQAHYPGLS